MDTTDHTSTTDHTTAPMPVLFIGHGSPMNAVQDNPFSRSLVWLGQQMPRPRAILCVSAHWQTPGVRVTGEAQPRTIHDFAGFPRQLYEVEYAAPGDPLLAREVAGLVGGAVDTSWGFDHGAWSVIRHMYPDADVPMIELSLDEEMSPPEHHAIGALLAPLRDQGVLIVGSGNLVHNPYEVRWEDGAQPYPWAVEFDEWARDRLLAGDDDALVGYESLGAVAREAHPTNEHYLPLLYAIALRRAGEPLSFFYEGVEMGSLSMRGVRIG
jgi:4,5-DOPA dioxygenase extradiol